MMASGIILDEADKISYLFRSPPVEYNTSVFAMQTVMLDDASLAFVKQKFIDIELKIKEQKAETSAKVLSAEIIEKCDENESKLNNSENFN